MSEQLVSPGGTLHRAFLARREYREEIPTSTAAQKPESPFVGSVSLTEALISERIEDFFKARRNLGLVGLINDALDLRCRVFSINDTARSQRDIAKVNPVTGQTETFTFQPVYAENVGLIDWRAGMKDEFRSVDSIGRTGRTFLRISLSVGKDGPKVELKVGEQTFIDPDRLARETALHGSLMELITGQDLIEAYAASLMGRNPIGIKPPESTKKTDTPPENSQDSEDTGSDAVTAAEKLLANSEAVPAGSATAIVPYSPNNF